MKFVIAGYGKFGHLALDRILKTIQNDGIVVVDHRTGHGLNVDDSRALFVNADATTYLQELTRNESDCLIIPTVPFHLAASYLLSVSESLSYFPMPDTFISRLPNVYRMNSVHVCCSYADFICPDNCEESGECSVTGEIRLPMFEKLERMSIGTLPVLTLKSLQILPGVGGFYLSKLIELVGMASHMDRFIMVTSCRCHAIITGFSRHPIENLTT